MSNSKHTCQIFHFDLYGTREHKYSFLQNNNLQSVEWQELKPQEPSYFFVPKDFSLQKEYEKGFRIDELMKIYVSGIQTKRDTITIHKKKDDLKNVLYDFETQDIITLKNKYKTEDGRDWTVLSAKEDIKKHSGSIQPILYRIFDVRYSYFSDKTKGFMAYPRYDLMKNFLHPNIGFCFVRINRDFSSTYFITDKITDQTLLSPKDNDYVFPLYLYPKEGSIDMERVPNLDEGIWAQMNAAIGRETAPEDIFDYIYGVLHSPAYRTKYKEFLKIDFPRIPYPKDAAQFEHFRSHGQQLRNLHLMLTVPASPVTFPEAGNMVVEQVAYKDGRVQINGSQYFAGVPAQAWEFYIGGYQPAQKWLKDRKGRTLSFEDIAHYRNIISVLIETARIMEKIDA